MSVLLLFVFLQIKATGQDGDVIYIDGERWELLGRPISSDSVLYTRVKEFLPENHCRTTGNWNGYTAVWEIQDDYLYLLCIEVCVDGEDIKSDSTLIYDANDLQALFEPYYEDGKICARWLNETLRAGQGDLVMYVHLGFWRNVETGKFITIKDGKVMETKVYHNHKKPGWTLDQVVDEVSRLFPWERFPEYRGKKDIF